MAMVSTRCAATCLGAFLFGVAAQALPASATADVFKGRVVRISDGDGFVLLTSGQLKLRVRLAEIDAPERGQPWGRHARATLSSLVMGRNVSVRIQNLDHYGRVVGRVTVVRPDGGLTDVNATMVRWGEA